jgi:hypothetical protein
MEKTFESARGHHQTTDESTETAFVRMRLEPEALQGRQAE